ncbi:MAG: maltose alpha-D-glucosyltransferase [Phenylobacterium sp.]|uniref:maltose alpha-D-glucosyltransferase n=1 Tax=Phenylobacterium sp. TaxID=1871053 RepID=UPI00391AF7AB
MSPADGAMAASFAGPELRDDPLWYKDAVIYQLHVKSFFDSNDDGVGDLPGLEAKLDYIAALGVTAIWLLPFYPSPRRDDGYDIADYRGVHPDYGDIDDLRRLIEAAHQRGLRVITELVINHTSDQHAWFQAARRAPPGSPERELYVWSDNDAKYAGTRIIFCDTETSNWTWDPVAGAYFWHRFYSHQPDLNYDNPKVLEEILSIMRFWMEMGIDGMRLDAIPYLVEREGTNNENLPETHDVLKRIRAELDANFRNRMLLAEANQWPEDTQQYFGEGDECQMAFHFPLMPRMYMAIAQEDRFPITDIMRQTPEIPGNCQWAVFLRNHDELTLEMVTNKERDYLWSVYAADHRARINLGIRRRLAPLMERDRRRIELMHSLLLSMPGTPIIYYGDEIGMGDNIHLGDRDGVRTPMQWSPDRNGGFSRADPAELTLPTLMDPLYGFQAVNVEAQLRDPHSLLNWLRRMLAVRSQHQAFGRGALRFLRPHNRKILAYLREYEGRTILAVANVSRSAQAVELELAEFTGRVPVEMTARTAFPQIGHLTYLLTLPPYGFYWFELCEHAEGPAWSTSSAVGPELHTFVLRGDLASLAEAPHRTMLEREVLPGYLAARRWFQGKLGPIEAVSLVGVLPAPDGEDQFIAELEVRVDGETQHYLLPVGVAWEDEVSPPYSVALALARVRRGARVGLLTDALSTPAFLASLVRGLAVKARVAWGEDQVVFDATAYWPAELGEEVEWLAVEQSNSSVRLGGAVVLKLLRRVTPGVHPEAEMTRVLTERGFANIPPLMGEVRRERRDGPPETLMIAQGFAYNQGDGWAWTLDHLHLRLDDALSRDNGGQGLDLEAYLNFAQGLGQRLAELHAVLAQPTDDPAFAPETMDAAAAEAWAREIAARLDAAFAALGRREDWADPQEAEAARAVIEARQALERRVEALCAAAEGAPRTRIHGDLHLGQILVTGSDVMFIDFEGEPARPLAARRAKASPMRDLAGVLRSLDYAAAKALQTAPPEAQVDRLAADLLAPFPVLAAEAVVTGYLDAGGRLSEPLLELSLIEKAAYEVAYEAANRPDWLAVPMRGLLGLARTAEGAA